MERLHDRKNHDYAEDGNPYSNFEKAAALAGIEPVQAVLTLIGVKTARIAELNKGKQANFEPLEDSLRDLAVYSVIALAMMGAFDDLSVSQVQAVDPLEDPTLVEVGPADCLRVAPHEGPCMGYPEDAPCGAAWVLGTDLGQ
jgi:hypothetical protein